MSEAALDNATPAEAPDASQNVDIKDPLPSSWLDSVPEEIKDIPSLSVFKAATKEDLIPVPKDLVKSYVHAQKLIGKQFAIPGPNSSPEEIKAFWSKLGVPESPSHYEFTVADNIPDEVIPPDEVVNSYREVAHKLHLTPEQAQGLFDWYAYVNAQYYASNSEAAKAQKEKLMRDLQTRWGAAARSKIAGAQNLLEKYGTPELKQVLQASGLHDHPQLIEFLASVADQFAEDVLRGQHQTKLGILSPEDASRELEARMRDPELQKAYFDEKHPGHKAEVEYRQRLYKLKHGEYD